MTTDTHHDRKGACPFVAELAVVKHESAEHGKRLDLHNHELRVSAVDRAEIKATLAHIIKSLDAMSARVVGGVKHHLENGTGATIAQQVADIIMRGGKIEPRPLIPGVSVKEAVLALTGFAAALIAVAAYVGGITP
jgi:hypothetical protein